ncbi:MAG: hypothetical protein GPJ07_18855 [Microcystis aeruginosa G13-07]|nr:hypothetical protein [Microcystis aeruginosa G13-07]
MEQFWQNLDNVLYFISMFEDPLSRLKKASLGFAFGSALGAVIAMGTTSEDWNPYQKWFYGSSIASIGGIAGLAVDGVTGSTERLKASIKRNKHDILGQSLINRDLTPTAFLQEYIKLVYSDLSASNLEYRDKQWLIEKVIPRVLRVIPEFYRYSPEYMKTLLEDLYSFLKEEAYQPINVGVGQPILLIQKLFNPQLEIRIAAATSTRWFEQYNLVFHNRESYPQRPALEKATSPTVEPPIPLERTEEEIAVEEEEI